MMTNYNFNIILSLVCLIILTNCSFLSLPLLHKEAYSPITETFSGILPEDKIAEVIKQRAGEVKNLWAEMTVKIKTGSRAGSAYFRATLLFSPPDKARLRGYRQLTSTLFEILVNNEGFVFHLNREKELYVGNIKEWINSSFPLSEVDVREVAYLLQPLQIFSNALQRKDCQLEQTDRNYYFFNIFNLLGSNSFTGKIQMVVRKQDLLIQEIRIYTNSGSQTALVLYQQYRYFSGGTLLPTKVTIMVYKEPMTMTKVQLSHINYKVNEVFSPKVFLPPTYEGIKIYPLSKLMERSGY
ncbi:MAG: hypothetical protein N2246_00595 [Candidatus Sumerlaeia bacterium]|nr:hypothetical protein [Candidatus Sumerlaeia bacterium]